MAVDVKKCYACSRKRNADLTFDIPDASKNKEPYYKVWVSLTNRATNPKYKNAHNAYRDCIICDEWRTLSNFKKWFEDPQNGYQTGLHIDKDILVKGNKVYSPQTCCLVPVEINSLLTNRKQHRGEYPIGVTKLKNGRYQARIGERRKTIGTFISQEEAFNAYKDVKELHIKSIAEKYFQEGKITKKVYDALMKYEVEMTD